MNRLPIWRFPFTAPAFYDTESFTAIEAAAKVYESMRALVDEYNKFAEQVNKAVDNLEKQEAAARQKLEDELRKSVKQFICEYSDKFNLMLTAADLPAIIDEAYEKAKADGTLKGDPGYTPQKGVDYYTPEDKEEMVTAVIEALPEWEGGEF